MRLSFTRLLIRQNKKSKFVCEYIKTHKMIRNRTKRTWETLCSPNEGNSSLHTVHDNESVVVVTKVYALISNFRRVMNVVVFLLGDSPTSEFYVPTFRNALSVPSSYALCIIHFGWFYALWIFCADVSRHCLIRSVGTYNSDAEESPKIKNTISP
jgi:hypothetical protein